MSGVLDFAIVIFNTKVVRCGFRRFKQIFSPQSARVGVVQPPGQEVCVTSALLARTETLTRMHPEHVSSAPSERESWWLLCWSEPGVVLPPAGGQPTQPGRVCSDTKPRQPPTWGTSGPQHCFNLRIHSWCAALPASAGTVAQQGGRSVDVYFASRFLSHCLQAKKRRKQYD